MDRPQLVYSLADGRVVTAGWPVGSVGHAAVNISGLRAVQVPAFNSSGPTTTAAGAQMIRFPFRAGHAVLHSGCPRSAPDFQYLHVLTNSWHFPFWGKIFKGGIFESGNAGNRVYSVNESREGHSA